MKGSSHDIEESNFSIENDDVGEVSPSESSKGLLQRTESEDRAWQLSIDNFKTIVKHDDELKKVPKSTKRYYKQQNALVSLYEETLGGGEAVDVEHLNYKAKIAINASFTVNVILTLAKLYAAIASSSIAVLASAIDSVLDILSGSIIFITTMAMKKTNPYKYPAGKTRMEPLGVIIFASCMFTAALQLIVEGARVIAEGKHDVELGISTYVIIGFTIVSKLILFLYCRLQTSSLSAMALAQDHWNDTVVNTAGLGCAILAFNIPKAWWVDPMTGMLMGLYIMFTWFNNGYEQVKILAGSSADKDFIAKITFLCWNHHPKVVAIDTVRAFHLANGFMVEIDIVLPPDLPLQEAHDIGESLQIKLEAWDEVERCFVHLDYETDHKPEHKWIGGKSINT